MDATEPVMNKRRIYNTPYEQLTEEEKVAHDAALATILSGNRLYGEGGGDTEHIGWVLGGVCYLLEKEYQEDSGLFAGRVVEIVRDKSGFGVRVVVEDPQ